MTEIVSVEARAVSGSGSIEEVYRAHHARMWRAVLAYCGDRAIADDAVAEAFAQALRRGSAIRHPDRWIWRSVFRIAAGLLKDRSRFLPEVEAPVAAERSIVELQSDLMKLSPRQRAAMFLYYYGGYPPLEIARMIGSSQSAVRVHLFRGRKRMRRLMEEALDD